MSSSYVDASVPAGSHAQDLADAGVKAIGRYYDYGLGSKVLTRLEAQALIAQGISIWPVFEFWNNEPRWFTKAYGEADAARALQCAQEIVGQPEGSTIYFGADYDETGSNYTSNIVPYFTAVKAVFTRPDGTMPYRIGVYSNGLVCRRLVEDGLVSDTWLSCSTDFTEHAKYLASGKWRISQTCGVPSVGGVDVDDDDVNGSDFGQFDNVVALKPMHFQPSPKLRALMIANANLADAADEDQMARRSMTAIHPAPAYRPVAGRAVRAVPLVAGRRAPVTAMSYEAASRTIALNRAAAAFNPGRRLAMTDALTRPSGGGIDSGEFASVEVRNVFTSSTRWLEGPPTPEVLDLYFANAPLDGFDFEAFNRHILALGLVHFTPIELLFLGASNSAGACMGKNGPPPQTQWSNIDNTACMLDRIRDVLGAPIHILSGYRAPDYNACIGGASDSQHMRYCAIDWYCDQGSPADWHTVAQQVRDERPEFRGGIGIYEAGRFVHIDTRGSNVDWSGPA
jgi:hypothetical protein